MDKPPNETISYQDTVWQINNIMPAADDHYLYNNAGIESEYSAGNIIIFDVSAVRNGKEETRTISVARKEKEEWLVLNEGF